MIATKFKFDWFNSLIKIKRYIKCLYVIKMIYSKFEKEI